MKKDHVEILLEDIRGKLDLVFEGHAMLNNKIDRVAIDLNQKIDDLNEKITLETRTLHQKIDKVAADLHQKIDKVAADLGETNRKLDQVRCNGYKSLRYCISAT